MSELQQTIAQFLGSSSAFELSISGDSYVFRAAPGSTFAPKFGWGGATRLGSGDVAGATAGAPGDGEVRGESSRVGFVDDRALVRGVFEGVHRVGKFISQPVGGGSFAEGGAGDCGSRVDDSGGHAPRGGSVASGDEAEVLVGAVEGGGQRPSDKPRTVNQAKRDRRKRRLCRRKAGATLPGSGVSAEDVPEWRRKGVEGACGGRKDSRVEVQASAGDRPCGGGGSGRGWSRGRSGFFSSCDDDVQRSLRDSRAELLIAKNRHEKMLVDRKISDVESNVQVVSDAMKYMRLQAQLVALERKNVELLGKSRVGGWAQTVLSGATDSFVSKAASERSSVPSLESVGVSSSASQPSAEEDARMALRKVEYNIAVQQMELDLGPYYTASDYNTGLELVREAFSDLVFSDTENALRAVGRKIVEKVGFESDPALIRILYEEDMIDLPSGYFEGLNARRSAEVESRFEDF